MYSVATPIWNKIANTQPLKTDWAKRMFPLEEEQMSSALET